MVIWQEKGGGPNPEDGRAPAGPYLISRQLLPGQLDFRKPFLTSYSPVNFGVLFSKNADIASFRSLVDKLTA